jgi:adenine phosphoribosyltransferase
MTPQRQLKLRCRGTAHPFGHCGPLRHSLLVGETVVRDRVLATFRWVDGHADMWRLFGDADALAAVVEHLAGVVARASATKVAGIESRGFILGGAVAVRAGIGFVPVRKEGGLFPGPKVTRHAAADYRGIEHLLRLQQQSLSDRDRVLLVDDWAELGSQALAARQLIEQAGATWAGAALIVDQLKPSRRAELEPVTHIVRADELGPAE